MFNHVECDLPTLSRKTIDGVRYYTVNDRPMVSITSVTSHFNKHIFVDWRKRVGNEEADRVTKRATSRGTKVHTLIENHLLNKDVVLDNPSSKMLFTQSKKLLQNINNIYALEKSLYNGELSIIDFKTAAKPKPREWIENYFVQAAAYACMFYERTNIPVKKLVILMTCENGEVTVYEEYDKMKYMKLLVKYIEKFVEDKCQVKQK